MLRNGNKRKEKVVKEDWRKTLSEIFREEEKIF